MEETVRAHLKISQESITLEIGQHYETRIMKYPEFDDPTGVTEELPCVISLIQAYEKLMGKVIYRLLSKIE